MRIVLAHDASSDVRCFQPSGAQRSDEGLQGVTIAGSRVDTVRISVRVYVGDSPGGNFLCDRVLHVPRDTPSIHIPIANGVRALDIYGEAFAPVAAGETQPRRVAVGALLHVPVTVKGLPDLRLYPDERFRCHNQRMVRPRAFHTATLLPNGQLLLVGGLTPAPDPNQEGFGAAPLFIAPDAEIYDPATGSFTPTKGDAVTPRAFHQAALVGTNSDGKYQLLLVGGATNDPTMPAFGVNTGAAPGTRLVPFDTSMTIPNPLAISAAPTELILFDPSSGSITHDTAPPFTPGVYQAAAPFADGVAVAGGIDWKGMPLQMTIPSVPTLEVSRALESPPRSAALPTARMGASLTALGDDTALLWGGAIAPTDPAGYFVSGLGSKNSVKLTAAALAAAPPTQFHSADALPATMSSTSRTILVTGGFVQTTTSMGQALQPPTPAQSARLLTVTAAGVVSSSPAMLSGYTLDSGCTDPMRYRPAGWQSAVALGRGRVLVTGGAPTITGACNDCDGGGDYRCATQQASLFTAPATLAPTTEKMQVPRYGHTATLMRDGNVLITGGATAAGAAARLIDDVEVYNPRPMVPLYDPSTGSPDPDDPIAADLTGATPPKSRAPGQTVSPASVCGIL